MPRRSSPNVPPADTSPPLLPLLLLLFVGSGACALIYEVVWFQLLELVVGSSAISIGVLLATYMGGMCIGSLALPRFIPKTRHPLRIYAALELTIGVIGVLELFAIPLIGKLYSPVIGHGLGAVIVRGVVAAICLLPPTILMGATLPAIARWVESSRRGVSWLGFFYGGNIIGAVLGSVSAGFYLLRVHDQAYATYVAALLNFVVAGIAWLIASLSPAPAFVEAASNDDAEITSGSRAVYIAIGISGACALAAEVVWTRLLSLTFGASTYTFSMILAVFLAGLGVGSSVGAWLARVVESPRAAFAWCQLLLMVAIAWGAAVIFVALPNWPINPSLAPSAWYALQLDLVRCALAVLPAACLWGASFPLALAALVEPGQDTSRLVGRLYAANTVGAILGAVICSIVLIPVIGTRDAQRVLIALSAIGGVLLLVSQRRDSSRTAAAGILAPAIAAMLAVLLIATMPALPGVLVAHGRWAVTWLGRTDMLYIGEGMNSSIAVTKVHSSGATQFHVSGKVEASSLPEDMRLQRMLAHLPALVHPNPKSVLVVGFGAGVTAGSFLPYPGLERLVICEIEPLIPEVVSTWFVKENNNVKNDPRTQIYYDDARSYVLTSDEKFDIITSDPINPWVKGAASLYTREYFESVKRHLKPGGVVTQWVPLYESTLDAVRSELKTFFEVFPNGTVWANNVEGHGYDLVLLAQVEPTKIDVGALQRRFANPAYQGVATSLTTVGFTSPIALFATYAGQGSDMAVWLRDAAVNTDRNLRLQYLAGVGLNQYTEAAIYEQIAQFRRSPDALFVADEDFKRQVREAIR
jgi:spermidine synthase